MTGKTFAELCLQYKGITEGSAEHKALIDCYNTIKPLPRGYKMTYTDPWCAAFISAVAQKFCVTNKIDCECSAHNMYLAMLNRGEKIDSKSGKIGDVIFYEYNGDKWVDHVGVITNAASSYYDVIEGNNSNAVKLNRVAIGNSSIFAVCRPKWDVVDTSAVNDSKVNTKSIDTLAKEVIRGSWGNGSERKKRLENCGYNYELVQKKVNEMLSK